MKYIGYTLAGIALGTLVACMLVLVLEHVSPRPSAPETPAPLNNRTCTYLGLLDNQTPIYRCSHGVYSLPELQKQLEKAR